MLCSAWLQCTLTPPLVLRDVLQAWKSSNLVSLRLYLVHQKHALHLLPTADLVLVQSQQWSILEKVHCLVLQTAAVTSTVVLVFSWSVDSKAAIWGPYPEGYLKHAATAPIMLLDVWFSKVPFASYHLQVSHKLSYPERKTSQHGGMHGLWFTLIPPSSSRPPPLPLLPFNYLFMAAACHYSTEVASMLQLQLHD